MIYLLKIIASIKVRSVGLIFVNYMEFSLKFYFTLFLLLILLKTSTELDCCNKEKAK